MELTVVVYSPVSFIQTELAYSYEPPDDWSFSITAMSNEIDRAMKEKGYKVIDIIMRR